jgi:PST family polysaccharide transporter
MTSSVYEMLGFGGNLLGFSMVDFMSKNIDRVALGSRSGARSLGYYQSALLVYDNIMDLTFPLHSVAVSSLSRFRDDAAGLRTLWAKALSTLAFYAMPAFGILAVAAQDIVITLLGPKWSTAAGLLSILALRGPPHVIERTLGWLHVACGRTDRWMRWGIFATCVQAVALFAGLPFGSIGVVFAYVLVAYLLFVPAIAFAGRPVGIESGTVVRVVGWQLAGTLISAAAGFLLRHTLLSDTGPILRVMLLSSVYAALYLFLVAGVFKVRAPIGVVRSLASDLLASRLLLSRKQSTSLSKGA